MLSQCLESVFRYTDEFELVLVDNGSIDKSEVQATVRYPQITLLKNDENVGFAKANNRALERVRGDWIVLLNPDTVVSRSWLENLVKRGTSSEIGIVTPKLLRLDGRTIDSAGLVFDFRTGSSYDRGSGEVDLGQYDREELVPCCTFACVAIKRDTVNTVGLLDNKMVMYFDDIDYCVRTRVAGWKVLYCPSSVVYHARSGVTPKHFTRVQRWSVAYRLRIMLKCYSTRYALKYGTLRILRDFISAAAGLRNHDLDYFLGYLRSPFWNAINLPTRERKHVQRTRRVSDDNLFVNS